jgi:hypothetical protein
MILVVSGEEKMPGPTPLSAMTSANSHGFSVPQVPQVPRAWLMWLAYSQV